MGDIVPFDFEEHAVRVIMRDDAPWFVAADVCLVLEVSKYRDAMSRLDDDEKGVLNVDTLGGAQNVGAINESGLYALILTSRKPQAKRFRKWVTAEVLPAIRRVGRYEMAQPVHDPFAQNASRVAHVADHLQQLAQMNDLVLRVTHLPIWKSGRRPRWWHDFDVREFVTLSHRQMSLLEAERIGADRFGRRCPRKSAIHSYWSRLDMVLGPVPTLPTPSKKDAA